MAFEEIIKQAIRFEQESYAFYDRAARIVKSEQARTILQDLRGQEETHKAKLEAVLDKGPSWAVPLGRPEETMDLKIGEHALPSDLDSKADFQDALLVAMKREQASYDFYTTMAGLVSDDAKPIFEFLANEEAKHKNDVQKIYDEIVYQDF